MEFKKTALILALSGALAACGGSSEQVNNEEQNLNGGETSSGTSEPVSETKVSGYAGNGSFYNANVNVFSVNNGAIAKVAPDKLNVTNIKTDENGYFEFTIKDYEGALKVQVTADNDTIAICDATVGCGEYDFSEQLQLAELDKDLSLSSFVYIGQGQNEIRANITPVTYLASGLVESKGAFDEESIFEVTSKVASLFSLDPDITTIKPTAIHDKSELESVTDTQTLKYALVNTGIMNNVYKVQNDQLLPSDKLTLAMNDLANFDGHMLALDDGDEQFELNAQSTYGEALEAAKYLAENVTPHKRNHLNVISNELNNDLQVKLASSEELRIEPVASEKTSGIDIEKAKAMVNDFRMFANFFGLIEQSEQDTQSKKFINLLERSSELVNEEMSNFILLSEVTSVVSRINSDINNGISTNTLFNISHYSNLNGITGTVQLDKLNGTFIINAAVGTHVIQVTAALQQHAGTSNYKLTLVGKLATAKTSLEITSGSYANLEQSDDNSITSGELNLVVSMQSTLESELKFDGKIETKLVQGDETLRLYFAQLIGEQEVSLVPQNLILNGRFTDSEGSSTQALLTTTMSNEQGLAYLSAILNLSYMISNNSIDIALYHDRLNNNTESYYLALVYKLAQLGTKRTLDIQHNPKTGSIISVNEEGVWLELFEKPQSLNNEVTLGVLRINEQEQAKIVKRDNLTFIKYNDGSVETL